MRILFLLIQLLLLSPLLLISGRIFPLVVTVQCQLLSFQIAAKIGGDAATTVNNNTPDFGFGGQKRQLEDGGTAGCSLSIFEQHHYVMSAGPW